MSLKVPGLRVSVLCCLAIVLAIGALALQAEEPQAGDTVKAQVEALLKMAPDARRAELKKMSTDERRSLWFELKQAEQAARGQQPLVKGTGLTPRPIAGGPKAVGQKRGAAAKAGAAGTIQYDDGIAMTTFGGGAIIGNRFDTALGDPIATTGTISTVVGIVMPGPAVSASPSAGFVIEGPLTAGGGAGALFSSWTNNGLTASTETVTFTGLGVTYSGDSFLVLFGDWANSYVPAFGTGSTQSQGFHGIVGYTGGTGPNITSTFDFGGTRNGLIRVTGNVLPVELMSFEVE